MEYRVDYKQMTNAQSDYVVPDGAMHLAVDAELQNGSYMAARVPNEACDAYKDFIPLYIHNVTSPQKVFTCGLKYNYDDGCFSFVILGDGEEHDILGDGETFSSDDYESELSAFCSIGNILCFTLHDEIKYAYYINGKWKLYDRLPPFVNLQFAAKRIAGTSDTNDNYTTTPASNKTNMLIANPYHKGSVSIENNDLLNVDNSSYGGACADETYCPPQSAFTSYETKENAVFAVVNTFITDGLEMGCFTFPVLVRYAVRLYNRDYLNVSPPILVFPVQATPTIARSSENEGITNVFHVCLERYRLAFKFDEETQARLQELAKFEIVDGIDIFLSEQIYTIRTDHLLNRHKKMGDGLYTPSFIRSRDFLNVPDVANFYHFKSFKRDLICNAREEEYIELGTNSEEIERLRYINTRTRLEVNSTSNSKVYADGMLAYNSRLLAYGVGTELGEMFDLRIMTPPILNIHDEVVEHVESDESFTLPEAYVQDNLYYNILPEQDAYDEGTAQSIRTGMTVRNGSSLATATIKGSDNVKQNYLPLYFYYPHTNGLYYYYEATNHTVGGKPSVLSGCLALQTSETDTSSYWFFPNRDSLASKISAIGANEAVPDSNTNTRVYNANFVKESEVNQPMTFADGNSVMCGNERVITVATSAMETSRGQFGQYPLFAFCTDGVFAISVGADGTLQSCVPYSYDVLVDKHSICNVERDIVFITKQGVVSIGEGRTLLLNADKRALCLRQRCPEKVRYRHVCRHGTDVARPCRLADIPHYGSEDGIR